MKKALAGTGYFSLTFMILGSLFKIQHYPGASIMLILGTFVFVIAFLPQYLIQRYKSKASSFEGLEAIAFTVSMAFLAIGLLFKIQHYPGGSLLLIIGFLSFIALFIPLYVYRFIIEKRQRQSQYILIGMITMAVTTMMFSHNISKETLSSYVLNEERLSLNNDILINANTALYVLINDSKNEDKIIEAEEIYELSQDMFYILEDYKNHLMKECDGLSDEQMEEFYGGELSLRKVHSKDNKDTPSRILIFDPGDPNTDEWSAINLSTELELYQEDMMEIAKTEKTRNQINALFTFEKVSLFGYDEPWEVAFFYHMPLVSVINTLTVLQNSCLTAESIALSELVKE